MAADVQGVIGAGFWRRSSRCSPEWNCVEVGKIDESLIIRDSKGRIALRALDTRQWAALLAHCRAMR
jgi:hypothetical protein